MKDIILKKQKIKALIFLIFWIFWIPRARPQIWDLLFFYYFLFFLIKNKGNN